MTAATNGDMLALVVSVNGQQGDGEQSRVGQWGKS
jgi:hypothetical protein